MKFNRVIRRAILFSVLSLVLAVPVQAATINLGGVNFVTYGDGNSYSLPIADLQFSTDLYTIPSSPGQISDLIVVATGGSGVPVTTNLPGIDNAYETPSGVGGDPYFYANPDNLNIPNPNGSTILNNGDLTWDASVAALLSFLGGDDLVFFFNNNQENSGGTSSQELAAWARLWITDPTGAVVPNSTFEFTNNDSKYDLVTNGGGGVPGNLGGNPLNYTASGSGAGNPSSTSAASTDFVLSGGQICVEYVPGNPAFAPIPVPCGSAPSFYPGGVVSGAINHNLGADTAAYAVIFPELNALLASLAASGANLSGYTLHFDGRFGCDDGTLPAPGVSPWMSGALANGHGTCLNNGYEQLFIGTADVDRVGPPIPEPSTVTMLALGFSLVGLAVRRRRTAR